MTNEWISLFKIVIPSLVVLAVAVLIYLLLRSGDYRERVSRAKDIIDDGRRGVDAIADGIEKSKDTTGNIADGIEKAVRNAEHAGVSVADAQESVRRSLGIIKEVEKRKQP